MAAQPSTSELKVPGGDDDQWPVRWTVPTLDQAGLERVEDLDPGSPFVIGYQSPPDLEVRAVWREQTHPARLPNVKKQDDDLLSQAGFEPTEERYRAGWSVWKGDPPGTDPEVPAILVAIESRRRGGRRWTPKGLSLAT
jgi:hypothetical protein